MGDLIYLAILVVAVSLMVGALIGIWLWKRKTILGYKNGYVDGLVDGNEDGYDAGYRSGFNDGLTANEGDTYVSRSGEYVFRNGMFKKSEGVTMTKERRYGD